MSPVSRVVSAIVLAVALFSARPVAAQTTVARPPDPPPGRWFIGGVAGVGGAGKTSGLAGGQLTYRLSDRIEVFGEGMGLPNLVTKSRRALAARVGTALAASQGRAVTTSVTVPAFAGGGGVRILLTSAGSMRPYVTGGGGLARLSLKPVFMLAGADVTTNLFQYGVTLGSDLTGTFTKPAAFAGAGIRAVHGRWYVDAGVRAMMIRTQPATNFIGAAVGFGAAF